MNERTNNRFPGWRTFFSVVLLFLSVGCGKGGEVAPPARSVLGAEDAAFMASQNDPVSYALTMLPTSGVVLAGRAGAICYSHNGDEEWRYEVPEGDEIVASPAVAPDSSTFILTRRTLVALSMRGEVLWTVDAEPAELPAVIALGDGTAVLTSGSNALVNVDTGRKRWRFELPDGDTIASIPRAASNSRIFVQGVARLYVVDPSGVPVWDRPL